MYHYINNFITTTIQDEKFERSLYIGTNNHKNNFQHEFDTNMIIDDRSCGDIFKKKYDEKYDLIVSYPLTNIMTPFGYYEHVVLNSVINGISHNGKCFIVVPTIFLFNIRNRNIMRNKLFNCMDIKKILLLNDNKSMNAIKNTDCMIYFENNNKQTTKIDFIVPNNKTIVIDWEPYYFFSVTKIFVGIYDKQENRKRPRDTEE